MNKFLKIFHFYQLSLDSTMVIILLKDKLSYMSLKLNHHDDSMYNLYES